MQRALEVAMQLARIGYATVRRGARPQRHHRVEGFKSFFILAKLDERIAHNAVIPRITWTKVACPVGHVQRVAKAVLGEINRAEHSKRIVLDGVFGQYSFQDLARSI